MIKIISVRILTRKTGALTSQWPGTYRQNCLQSDKRTGLGEWKVYRIRDSCTVIWSNELIWSSRHREIRPGAVKSRFWMQIRRPSRLAASRLKVPATRSYWSEIMNSPIRKALICIMINHWVLPTYSSRAGLSCKKNFKRFKRDFRTRSLIDFFYSEDPRPAFWCLLLCAAWKAAITIASAGKQDSESGPLRTLCGVRNATKLKIYKNQFWNRSFSMK